MRSSISLILGRMLIWCLSAATMAFGAPLGCSNAVDRDTQDRAGGSSGPLGKYVGYVTPLKTPCDFASKSGILTIWMNPNETAVVSKRMVDSALLVQGDTCMDNGATPAVMATASRVKTIVVTADASSGSPVDLSNTAEALMIDISGGVFAPATAAGSGIFVDLGGGTDEVDVRASTASDQFGCTVLGSWESLGFRSAASADVKLTKHPGDRFNVDLGGGNDSFDKGACTAQVAIYGGDGRDTFFAGTDTSVAGDHFSGGNDIDTISYATRTNGLVAVADGVTPSGNDDGATEQDLIDSDVENIIGGAGNDVLQAAADASSTHNVNGGPGDDLLISSPAGSTTFIGGSGIDTVSYSARHSGVVVTMGDGRANDGEPGDFDNVGLDVENLIGSAHDDVITGNGKSNLITPGDGDDTVNGGDGDDIIVASPALDGRDTISGGKGTDCIDYSARAQGVCVVLDGSSYSGQCTFALGNPAMNIALTDRDLVAQDVECAIGTFYDDHLVGNASVNLLVGLGGVDWLEGKAGDDQLDANLYLSEGGNACVPFSSSCIGPVTGACDCTTTRLSAVCSQSSVLDCGDDPLDLAACALANSQQFSGCWRVQN